MAPRDGGSTESLAGGSTSLSENVDWSWIDTLNPDGGKVMMQSYKIKKHNIPMHIITPGHNKL